MCPCYHDCTKAESHLYVHEKPPERDDRSTTVFLFWKSFCFSMYVKVLHIQKLNIWEYFCINFFCHRPTLFKHEKGIFILRRRELQSSNFEVRLSASKILVPLLSSCVIFNPPSFTSDMHVLAQHGLFWDFTVVMTVEVWAQSKPSRKTTYYSLTGCCGEKAVRWIT